MLNDCSIEGTKGNDIGGSKAKLQSWKATRPASPGSSPAPGAAPGSGSGGGGGSGSGSGADASTVMASDESSRATERDGTFSSKQYILSGNTSTHEAETAKCRAYLKHMSRVRLLHLTNGGNHFAARMLADNMIEDSPTTFKINEPPSASKFVTYMSGMYAALKRYFIKTFLSSSGRDIVDCDRRDCDESHSNASVKSKVDLKGAARSVYTSLQELQIQSICFLFCSSSCITAILFFTGLSISIR
jgi:hypothetical protein